MVILNGERKADMTRWKVRGPFVAVRDTMMSLKMILDAENLIYLSISFILRSRESNETNLLDALLNQLTIYQHLLWVGFSSRDIKGNRSKTKLKNAIRAKNNESDKEKIV